MELYDISSELEIYDLANGKDDTESILCSLVYRFASQLPYSMDYMDPLFVPGDFLNYMPVNPKKYLFVDYGSLYNKLINWGDTILTGIQLQVCNIFQKMLISNSFDRYQLSEEDYYLYGFDKLTSMELYNKNVFNLLVDLPKYCKRVSECETTDERRRVIEEVYSIISKVTSYVEKIKRSNVEITSGIETVMEEIESYKHFWSPKADLEMMYYFNRIENYKYLEIDPIIESIKDKLEDEPLVPRLY